MQKKKTFEEKERCLHDYLEKYYPYKMMFWKDFDYSVLSHVNTFYIRRKKQTHYSNECVIMADTETSKDHKHQKAVYENHVCAWTISIRIASHNLVTLYGSIPSDHIECLLNIHKAMRGDRTFVFYHNLSYDWTFLRQFFFRRFGEPENQLNTKSHYPIMIEFSNGIILKDSLILAQRKLEKWANDLNVGHKKAVNAWDYEKIRDQQDASFSSLELTYIEHDTLAGAECIDAFKKTLNKKICQLPYTATGIVRESFRKEARKNNGRDWFLRQYLDFNDVKLSEECYHGGYTHQNRFYKSITIDRFITNDKPIICFDIASSYPYALISEKYPSGKFVKWTDMKPSEILKAYKNYAFLFTAEFYNIRLKNPRFPMPVLQYSKSETLNAIVDNGRIVKADYVKISICDIDLKLICDQYDFDTDYTICTNVRMTSKDYLPEWFTDFVYGLFINKTKLKGGDSVQYAIAKAMLNSCYGMCCQHVMQNDIKEDYATGEYNTIIRQTPDVYEKYLKNYNTFLPYQIGIYCTSYAMKNLFEIGDCLNDIDNWIYSDTDSCFGFDWNEEKLIKYNNKRIDMMTKRGYLPVYHNGRFYCLGIVEEDKICSEFKGIHSKCYCFRDAETNELKITVAGVPKNGVKCLKDNIDNFKSGFIFKGEETGKLTHTYFFEKIHFDKYGNEIGDSIDLSACDYLINDLNSIRWEELIADDIEVQSYEE